MPPADDESTAPQNLSIPFPFFDKLYPQLWVNVNGAISFNSKISTFTPTCKPVSQNYSMISPFWADIDTRKPIHGDAIYFRESFDEKVLSQAESEVINAFPNLYGIKLKSVFIVTWFNVTFFNAETHPWEKRNTFQSAIATNGIYSFAIFYYNEITWTTGDQSNGTNGVGGTPAQAGFDAGDGKNRLMLGGSCKNEILTIEKRSNVNSPGKWIFRVDSANIETAGCTAEFAPSDILKISPSYVTSLGQVAVEVSGPCLKPSSTTSITCRIYDPSQPPFISVKGKIVGSQDSIKVICGIPYLFSIGRMKIEIVIFDNLAPISFFNTTYHGFLYVTNSNPQTNTLNIKVNKDSNGTAESTAFSWNPKSFVNGTNFLDMKLIIFDLSKKQPEMQSEIKIGDKIENSGKWNWNFKENGNSLSDQICNQFGIKVVFQAIEFGWNMLEGNDYRSHWIINSEIDDLFDRFTTTMASEKARINKLVEIVDKLEAQTLANDDLIEKCGEQIDDYQAEIKDYENLAKQFNKVRNEPIKVKNLEPCVPIVAKDLLDNFIKQNLKIEKPSTELEEELIIVNQRHEKLMAANNCMANEISKLIEDIDKEIELCDKRLGILEKF
uniref:NIDO domain-containing protein n=1 Tax=Panagrolaimus sp. PS1159 TaxID=55785 RepID=A0AC35FP70_9BILA